MKILVVDDQRYNRELLSFILSDGGYVCVEAVNGLDACEKFQSIPDIALILMDVTMPVMDGVTATKSIKAMCRDSFIPVIFVTALDDAEVLEKCLDAGGDDFVPKPVNDCVLLAKIRALQRTRILYDTVKTANKQLEYHKGVVDREHQIVECMFARCANRIATECANVKKYTSPMSMFNGDIILEAPSPSGGVYVLVGDFTGHGLAASIGTLPVAEIFYRLAAQQASVSLFAKTMNSSLADLLPDNMFFCAAIAYLDNQGRTLSLWAGGMNDLIHVPASPSLPLINIPSEHMPLGVLRAEEFDDSPLLIDVAPGDRFYVFTDGVNEARNSDGEVFGLARVSSFFQQRDPQALAALVAAVHHFQNSAIQSDDISLLEIAGGPVQHRDKQTLTLVDIHEQAHLADSFPWEFKTRLQNQELRNTNIVDQLMTLLGGIQGIELHREKIFTIVSELYSNALEHGVLQLTSELKQTADGFEEYYRLRKQRLENIDGQFIDLSISFHKGAQNHIELTVSDSGKGFDHAALKARPEADDAAFGRGLSLLETLCSSMQYSQDGRSVRAIYTFRP